MIDLMSYDGSPSKDNLSPYDGMMYIVRKQCGNLHGEPFDMQDMIEYVSNHYSDYDPASQKPAVGTPYFSRDKAEREACTEFATRLEDIHPSWIANYVQSLLIGYKRNPAGRSRHMKAMAANITFTDDENDKSIEETELVTDADNTTTYDIDTAKRKLPYLLKRVHWKSRELETSLISMYGQFLRVKQYKETVNPRDLLRNDRYRVWKMTSSGDVVTTFTENDNHNSIFPEAFKFVTGAYPTDPYYVDLLEFGRACDALGISLWLEDPRDYDQKFMDNFIVDYIKSNNDFLWNNRMLSSTVIGALRTVSTNDIENDILLPDEDSIIYSLIMRIRDTTEKEAQMAFRGMAVPDVVTTFFISYVALSKDEGLKVTRSVFQSANPNKKIKVPTCVPNCQCMNTTDGFYCLPGQSNPYVFDTRSFMMFQGNSHAILHSSGYLLLLGSRNSLVKYCHVADAVAYIRTVLVRGATAIGSLLNDGKQVGEWMNMYI